MGQSLEGRVQLIDFPNSYYSEVIFLYFSFVRIDKANVLKTLVSSSTVLSK